MKKLFKLLFVGLLIVLVSSCDFSLKDETKYTMIMPTGSPSIALSSFVENNDKVEFEIVSGSDPLAAAFSNQNYDIIVAPVNLGAKFYNQIEDFDYCLYQPIVGCGFYIMSTEAISSFTELDGKDVVAFNENATPGVMLKALSKFYDITPNIIYLSGVNEANSMLVNGTQNIILSAEPSKTIISSKGTYYSLDIAECWKELAGDDYNVPQAGIFVKKSLLEKRDFQKLLEEASNSLFNEASILAKAVISVDPNFKSMNETLLTKAIPNCHFITSPLNKAEVEFYFAKLIELGLAKTIGGRLPDEAFYYQKN